MAIEIRWTIQSINDIISIAQFISENSPYYSQVQSERFFQRVSVLRDHPRSGRVVPETDEEHIRELIEGNYRIIYRIVSEQRIDVLTVHHSSRLLKNIQ